MGALSLEAQQVPTPLQPGSTIAWNDLANPNSSEVKTNIIARYKIYDEFYGKPIAFSQVLLGMNMTSISKVMETRRVSSSEAVTLGAPPDLVSGLVDDLATGQISGLSFVYNRYVDLTWAPPIFEQNSYGSHVIQIQGDGRSTTAKVRISGPLGDQRHFSVPLMPTGSTGIQINSVHAGVSKYELELRDARGVSRVSTVDLTCPKDQATLVDLNGPGGLPAAQGARISRIALVQGVQNDSGTAYVIAGNPARLRVWIADPQAVIPDGSTLSITAWVPSQGAQTLVTNAPLYASMIQQGLAFQQGVQGVSIEPGTTFNVTVNLPGLGTLNENHAPNIVQGADLDLQVFEVRPFQGASGVPVSRDSAAMRSQIVQWAEAMLPVKGINIQIRHTLYIPGDLVYPTLPWQPPNVKYSLNGMFNVVSALNWIAAQETLEPSTRRKIYLGMINDRYNGTEGTDGMAPWDLPGIALFMGSQEGARATLPHEIGHCFGLWHTPAAGVSTGVNRVDWNFPYSGDGMIAFSGWDRVTGGEKTSGNHDLMTYANPLTRWISDYTWQHFYERVQQANGFPLFAATRGPAPLTVEKDSRGTLLFGPRQMKEARDLLKRTPVEVCISAPMAGPNGLVLEGTSSCGEDKPSDDSVPFMRFQLEPKDLESHRSWKDIVTQLPPRPFLPEEVFSAPIIREVKRGKK